MAINVKLAFLRAHHDPSYPQISDLACSEMFIANAQGTATLQYWSEVTEGHFDFTGSQLFPWVDIPIFDSKMKRAEQVRLAIEATQRVTGDFLVYFQGFVVLVHPGILQVPHPLVQQGVPSTSIPLADAGMSTLPDGRRCATIHYLTRDHSFMCHEIGHVLGLEHTFGLVNTGADWDGATNGWITGTEYGDPYDIMSSGGFGKCGDKLLGETESTPVFVLPCPNGWAVTGPQWLPAQATTTSAGPAPARAQVHFAWPEATVRNGVTEMAVPKLGEPPRRVRLYASDAGPGPRLIVMNQPDQHPSGMGRIYLEYRQPHGWDAGLSIGGPDLARQGVVAHTVAPNYAGETRVWYRGRIDVPTGLSNDLSIPTTPVSVRVVGVNDADRYVDLEVDTRLDHQRGVVLDVTRSDKILSEATIGTSHTPCGDEVRIIHRLYSTTSVFHPNVHGYPPDALLFSWSIGGQPFPSTAGSLTVQTASGPVRVKYSQDAASRALTLTSRRGDRFSIDITATVDAPSGSQVSTATEPFNPQGFFEGITPADDWKVDRCWQKWAKSKRLEPHQMLRLRDRFLPHRRGGVVLDVDRLQDMLKEHLGAHEYDDLQPEARDALIKILELQASGLR